MNPPFVIEPLAGHDLSQFESGVPVGDAWLKTSAASEMKAGRVACFVAVDRQIRRVAGAYAIALRLAHLEGIRPYYQTVLKTYPYLRIAVINHLLIDRNAGSPARGAAMLVNALYRAKRPELDVRMVILETLQKTHAEGFQSYGFVPDPHVPLRVFGRF